MRNIFALFKVRQQAVLAELDTLVTVWRNALANPTSRVNAWTGESSP